MGKNGGKTTGSGYINGSINNGKGHVEGGANVTHKPNSSTTIKIDGHINKPIHSRGKHNIAGGASITISKDF